MSWIDIIFFVVLGVVALKILAFLWGLFFGEPDEESMSFSELVSFYENDLRAAVRRGRKP